MPIVESQNYCVRDEVRGEEYRIGTIAALLYYILHPDQRSFSHRILITAERDRGGDDTRLRHLLAARNWKDADYETYLRSLKLQAI